MIDSILLTISSLITSTLSATIGMAGGTVLLSILLFFYPAQISIPLHALNQLVANFHRFWLIRKFVVKDVFLSFSSGALIGNILSAWLIKESQSFQHAPLLIALVILLNLRPSSSLSIPKLGSTGFFTAGLVLGFIGMFIGATGLLLASLFQRLNWSKEQLMATQGAIQSFSHGLKVLGFLWIGFDFTPWLLPLGLMVLAGLVGTSLGVHVFKKMSVLILTSSATLV